MSKTLFIVNGTNTVEFLFSGLGSNVSHFSFAVHINLGLRDTKCTEIAVLNLIRFYSGSCS